MDGVIQTDKLSKSYGKSKVFALKDLSISIKKGEVYGFLGANGAGKTTAIRTLMNFIQPTDGSATILGRDVVKGSVELKREVGYLSGEIALYPKMNGRQFLDYMSSLQQIKNKEYLKKLIKTFHAQLDKPIEKMSKGNRQKLGLIQALMHEPEVLILDEPTSGLDPLMQEYFFDIVKERKSKGATFFISSHNLSEAQRMCDRVGFIREGKLVAEQSIADLMEASSHSFEITFANSIPVSSLESIAGATIKKLSDRKVKVSIKGNLKPLFRILANSHVIHFDKPAASLEEEFLQFYESTNDRDMK